jgi:predicted nuclease of predicted toxin-antitoxin system
LKQVLLDENMPRQLRRDLPEFAVRTVQEEGWGAYKNGQLLRRAEATFAVLVTADRRMEFQQNLKSFAIGLVVIVTPRLRRRTILLAIEEIRAAIERVAPGQIIRIEINE